ncbi:MAG TPA: HDIG domain-containing protein [candidate division Zixibacteria bacterium]|nr:HDIG domain-containing protein [candidate division Zixibacteria bacterium]
MTDRSDIGLTREEAFRLVLEKIGHTNLLKHILAVEAEMRRLAERLGEDVGLWGLTGLLHDLDYNETVGDAGAHTFVTESWLQPYHLPAAMLYAIRAHPGHVPCRSRLDWALFATDPATGFIVACVLMHPAKRLDVIDADFMLRRFKEKRFAAGASRDNMAACTSLGLELEEFLLLVHAGMMTIRSDLQL